MTEKEYNECVRLHADSLYRFVFKNTRNTEDARDIVQSSFEKMWAGKDSVKALTCKAFLFTVAYHEVIDLARRKKRKIEVDDSPRYVRGSDHKKLIEMAFSRLTELQRSLVLLKDWEGYSYEEISGIMGLNSSQVRVYLHRARMQLRKFLGSLENVI
ncbi:MAG: RNA polymerase sigma factor [Chitinophagaceae bacterium]|nr:RNA polymerase sigma factor [Chitinophagaceae bacterium]